MSVVSKILSMNAAPGGNVYMVYNNETLGLDAQLINPELANQWENVVTVEERPLTGGMYMPTPLTDVNENDVLMLSYEVPTDWYGYQVVNHLTPEGTTASEALSLAGGIDGDAGSAAMGVKENRAFVAWEYAYSSSEYRMNVNVVDDFNNYFWIGDKTYGVTLETNDSWGYKPVKVIPVEEAWVVLYGNCTSWNGANFMVVKMDEFGEVIWTKQICEDNFKSNGLARNGRNGMLFTRHGIMNMRNKKWADDFSPLQEDGPSIVDHIYSKAYVRHLFIAQEILAMQIASIHNLAFYLWLVGEARKHIIDGDFPAWKRQMLHDVQVRL